MPYARLELSPVNLPSGVTVGGDTEASATMAQGIATRRIVRPPGDESGVVDGEALADGLVGGAKGAEYHREAAAAGAEGAGAKPARGGGAGDLPEALMA